MNKLKECIDYTAKIDTILYDTGIGTYLIVITDNSNEHECKQIEHHITEFDPDCQSSLLDAALLHFSSMI